MNWSLAIIIKGYEKFDGVWYKAPADNFQVLVDYLVTVNLFVLLPSESENSVLQLVVELEDIHEGLCI